MGSKAGTILKGKLAEYELIEVLKAGSLSTVWKARNLSSESLVALKIFNSMTSASAERTKKKLILEGFTTKLLEHPAICRVHDFFFMPDHTNGLVMEYLDGIDLADFILRRNHKPVPVRTALGIIRRVLEALDYSHNLKLYKNSVDSKYDKILHLDIKPGNIFLTSAGEVKLIDFGISRIDSEEIEIQHMGHGFTRTYSAPELWDGSDNFLAGKYNESHDLYSSGLVFYELITGREAFSNVYQARTGKIKSLSNFGHSEEVIHLFKRWTGSDLSKRFSNAKELIGALDSILESLSPDEIDISEEVESTRDFISTDSSSTVFNTIVTSHVSGNQPENLMGFLKLCLLTHLTPLAGEAFDKKPFLKTVMVLCIERNIKTPAIVEVDDVLFHALFEIFKSFDAGTSLAYQDFKSLIIERVQFLNFLRLSLGQEKCYEFYQLTMNFLRREKTSSEVLTTTLFDFRTRLMLDPFRCHSEDAPEERFANLAYNHFLSIKSSKQEREEFVRREVNSKCFWVDEALEKLKERLPSEMLEHKPEIPISLKQIIYGLAAKFVSKAMSHEDKMFFSQMKELLGDKEIGIIPKHNISVLFSLIPKGDHAFVISRVLCFIFHKKTFTKLEADTFSLFAAEIEKSGCFHAMTEIECFYMMEPVLAFRDCLPRHKKIVSRVRKWLPFTNQEVVKSFLRFHQISYLFDDPCVSRSGLKSSMELFLAAPVGNIFRPEPQFLIKSYLKIERISEPEELLFQFELMLGDRVKTVEGQRFIYLFLELEIRFQLESGASEHQIQLEEDVLQELLIAMKRIKIPNLILEEALKLIQVHYNITIMLPQNKTAKAA